MAPVVVPILAPLLVSAGVGGVTALSVSIAVGGFLATAGTSLLVGVALSFASAAIQRGSYSDRGRLSAGINSPETRLNTRQEVPSQRRVYGDVIIGGPLFFEQNIDPKYYQGFLLSEGPITSAEEIFNSQTKLQLGGVGFGNIETPLTNIEGQPPYVGNCRVSVRQGRLDQAIDPILAEAFPALDVARFRQRGVATLVFEANYGATFEEHEQLWGSARRPNPTVRILGVPVYDPRDATQRLPVNPNDPEEMEAARLTWKWSNTAALVQSDYLWYENGGRIPLGSINWDRVARSADYDESLIGVKDGAPIRRHTIDGVVTAGQQPVQILQSMLSSNRGFICRQQGRVWVQSSQPIDKPRITITDDMIVGGLESRRTQPKRNLVNRVRTRFIDPRQQWTQVDGPILDRPDLQADDQDLYEATVDVPWTADHRRAQRLAKLYLEGSRLGRTIRFGVTSRVLGLEAGDVVRIQLKHMPRANGVYRIEELRLSDDLQTFTVTATEYDPSIESSWSPADEQPFELPELEVT